MYDDARMELVVYMWCREIGSNDLHVVNEEDNAFYERDDHGETWISFAKRLCDGRLSPHLRSLAKSYLVTRAAAVEISSMHDERVPLAWMAYHFPGQPKQLRCTELQEEIFEVYKKLRPLAKTILQQYGNLSAPEGEVEALSSGLTSVCLSSLAMTVILLDIERFQNVHESLFPFCRE